MRILIMILVMGITSCSKKNQVDRQLGELYSMYFSAGSSSGKRDSMIAILNLLESKRKKIEEKNDYNYMRGLAAARLAIAYAQIGDASNEAHWQKESVTSINQSPQVRQKVIWSDIEEIVLQLDN